MNNNENKSEKLSLLIDFIQWLDSWKKVGIFLVLTCFMGAAYFSYYYRDAIFTWVLYIYNEPVLEIEGMETEISNLIKDTHADAIAIWGVERRDNFRVLRYLSISGKRKSKIEGRSDLILRARSEQSDIIIDLFNNGTGCFYLSPDSDMGDVLLDAGIDYFCASTTPPDYSFLNGFVMVGFKKPPLNQDYIKQRLRITSSRLTQ
ncbi:hypothetical protein [Aeromonas aquatica]|uniref:hypothetical protein n=1 Tax=Aeromonas aquatica TaxID=558964 RepID=UPI00286F0840|nr:hypothetical protein [Aeromonas aquatica]